jgi:hypothetical protein
MANPETCRHDLLTGTHDGLIVCISCESTIDRDFYDGKRYVYDIDQDIWVRVTKGGEVMGETEDRKREARETDQSISDRQRAAVADDRDERAERLGIGQFTEAGPQSKSSVGGNLPAEIGTTEMQEANFREAEED